MRKSRPKSSDKWRRRSPARTSANRRTFTVPETGWNFDSAAAGLVQGEDDTELAIFWPGGDSPELYPRACEWTGTGFDPGPSVDDRGRHSASCDGGKYSLSSGRWYQTTGQADDMNILDFDGERQTVVVSTTPGTPNDVVDQLRAMVASLEIEQR